MKFKTATCSKIAQAIVGEGTPLRTRSTSKLLKFLHSHDVDAVVRKYESKFDAACRAVNSLDNCSENDNEVNGKLIAIIEDLAGKASHTSEFGEFTDDERETAVGHLNGILAKHGLEVQVNDDEVSVHRLDEIPISTGATSIAVKSKYVFVPRGFDPDEKNLKRDPKLVAVMMPFEAKFDKVIGAIKKACKKTGLTCARGDDIWEEDVVMDDVFALICRAAIVVCDLTDRNANVLYEMGIAQTLGKPVVMLAQSRSDIPFDVNHQRYLKYLSNAQGLADMWPELAKRLQTIHRQETERS